MFPIGVQYSNRFAILTRSYAIVHSMNIYILYVSDVKPSVAASRLRLNDGLYSYLHFFRVHEVRVKAFAVDLYLHDAVT